METNVSKSSSDTVSVASSSSGLLRFSFSKADFFNGWTFSCLSSFREQKGNCVGLQSIFTIVWINKITWCKVFANVLGNEVEISWSLFIFTIQTERRQREFNGNGNETTLRSFWLAEFTQSPVQQNWSILAYFFLNDNTTYANANVLVVVAPNSNQVMPAHELVEFVYFQVTRHKDSSQLRMCFRFLNFN